MTGDTVIYLEDNAPVSIETISTPTPVPSIKFDDNIQPNKIDVVLSVSDGYTKAIEQLKKTHEVIVNFNGYANKGDVGKPGRDGRDGTGGTASLPKIVSELRENGYISEITLDGGKKYTYIRDENNMIIEVIGS